MGDAEIAEQIEIVRNRIEEAKTRRAKNVDSDVHLVAVSKTKPVSRICEAYLCGHRDFGENYVNELVEKATNPEILEMCPEIRWHFIGHLQSNKVNKLLGVPNLHILHTVDSIKLADILDKAWTKMQKEDPLKIMIQVNTSLEDNKSGVAEEEVERIIQHILEKCKNLTVVGLMMIGYAEHDLSVGPNPEFELIFNIREKVCKALNLSPSSLGLSMGMSHDFEHAIELGSTYVRVGSLIFGERMKKS